MSTYIIKTLSSAYEVKESAGLITHAADLFDWSVTLPFSYLRDYALKKGWTIVPALPERTERVIIYHGYTYRIEWRQDNIIHIIRTNIETDEQDEISWKQLPDALKELL